MIRPTTGSPEGKDVAAGDSLAREQTASAKRIRRLKRIDRLAVAVITFGGIAVVISVIGILVFIGAETLPLFRPAAARLAGTIRTIPTPQTPELTALGADESGRYVYEVTNRGTIAFFNPETGASIRELRLSSLKTETITSASRSVGDFVALGTSDGRALLTQVRFAPVYEGEALKEVSVELADRGVATLDPKRAVRRVAYLEEGEQKIVAGQVSETDIGVWWTDSSGKEHRAAVRPRDGRQVTTLHVGRIGTVIAGTDHGEVYHWELGDGAVLTDISPLGSSPVTAMAYLIGHRSFVAGTADGHLSVWFRAPVGAEGSLAMVRAAEFESQGASITAIAPSTRDRTFATGSSDGRVVLRHQTSGRTLAVLPGTGQVASLVMTPKSDGLLVARGGAGIDRFAVANPHPEVSWRILFGKVWYEGYSQPEYVWQSTGATDDFETKLSLVPLVFGTIKGTFYALLFAIPLSVVGALYTSQFVRPSLRAKIKPTIEVMAALPSVVIGFVAGLYLAPTIERHLMAVGLFMVVLPVFGTSGFLISNFMPGPIRRRLNIGTELILILPLLLLGAWFALQIAPMVETALFAGDVRQWLTNLGVTFDQRNSLVVGIAMGFAVIPIIFTISEDAFSSVPSNLGAGSLALGASRWQTAVRVIIPTASPGVFSAIMVGFGRAVGETMIVLMATGNTPVLDWSIFNGFRTLSANLAVEIPEAPFGGTLYRTLFLAAALLFIMTFTLNTVAEIIRQRLRERYKAI